VLLVDPDHPNVQALYGSWGYRQIGIRQPFPDSPATPSCCAPGPDRGRRTHRRKCVTVTQFRSSFWEEKALKAVILQVMACGPSE
jgi:hypothetical protein